MWLATLPASHNRGNGDAIRVEHWRVAEQYGREAALNMAGRPARCDSIPVFRTIQYLTKLDYIGHGTEWDEMVLHGSLQQQQFLAYYVANGFVRAAAGFDRDKDTASLVELFSIRRDWIAAELGESPLFSARFSFRIVTGRTASADPSVPDAEC